MNDLEEFFKNWDLPKNKIIIIHSSLKPVYEFYAGKFSYAEITDEILNLFYKYFSPKTVLIPAYTYSYTKSGVYHNDFTKSESGRFSEECRLNYDFYRTPNPVFSYLDTEAYLKNVSEIDHLDAFSKKSVFGYLHNKDAVLVNMALEIFLATPIHYIEQMVNVEYRYFKNFPGILYSDKRNFKEINFEYQVRVRGIDTSWDRDKMLEDGVKHDIIHLSKFRTINFRWLWNDKYFDFLSNKLQEDEQYLFLNRYKELPNY